ncbi:MAG: PAS domain S-box protein [Bacteroidia bacterium]|nr:PAS domain S-box protein [Bacteroidia bacterium]
MIKYYRYKTSIYSGLLPFVYVIVMSFGVINLLTSEHQLLVMLYTTVTTIILYWSGQTLTLDRPTWIQYVYCILLSLLPWILTILLDDKIPVWLFTIIGTYATIFLLAGTPAIASLLLINVGMIGVIGYLQHDDIGFVLARCAVVSSIGFLSTIILEKFIELRIRIDVQSSETMVEQFELQKRVNLYRQMLNANEGGSIATDSKGIIIDFNSGAEELLGMQSKEAVNRLNIAELIDEKDLKTFTQQINARYQLSLAPGFEALVFKTKIGSSNSFEVSFKLQNNQRIDISLQVSNLKNLSKQVTGYLFVFKDVSKQKLALQQQYNAETIISNSPSVLFKWLPEPGWRVLYVSSNIKKVLGYQTIDFTSEKVSYSTLIHPEDINTVLAETDRAVKEFKTEIQVNYRLKHAKGNYIWVEEVSHINRNELNQVIDFEGIVTDITAKKEAELKLIESELRYELAVNGIAAGIWDWFDTKTGASWWSPKLFEMLGFKYQEIEPNTQTFWELIHPDDKEMTQEKIRLHLEHNIPFHTEYRVKTKQGTYKWFWGHGQVYRNEKGEPIRMVGSLIDIHDRKLFEVNLQSNEVRYRSLIESAIDIFYNTNALGRFVYVNDVASRITEYSIDELLTMNYLELIDSKYLQQAEQFYSNQFKKQIPLTYFEFPIITKTGKQKWIGQNVQLVYENQKFAGTQAIAREITALKTAQLKLERYTEELQAINKELDEFAYVVSHDLKAPLRAISNLSHWIKEDVKSHLTLESEQHFELMAKRIYRMEQFINGLLDYSRAGKRNLKPSRINIKFFVEDILQVMQLPRNMDIINSCEQIEVFTEALLLEQVLTNLISNAIKYNNNSMPLVQIKAQKVSNEIEFQVIDNGPGIAEAYQEKVFRIFQTLEPRDKIESTGIGLAIVKKIIDEKEGSIRIESKENEGCNFIFYWPLSLLHSSKFETENKA